MKKLYRIYYSTYDDNLHEQIVNKLEAKYKTKVVVHKSRVHPDFRFLELFLDEPGKEDEIRDLIVSTLGSEWVKVDWIDTSR